MRRLFCSVWIYESGQRANPHPYFERRFVYAHPGTSCRGLQASLESVSAELASEQRAVQEAREAAESREERLRTVLLKLSEAEDEARAQRRQADAAREVAANLTEKVTYYH
jgi:chromosome segregation ATPase